LFLKSLQISVAVRLDTAKGLVLTLDTTWTWVFLRAWRCDDGSNEREDECDAAEMHFCYGLWVGYVFVLEIGFGFARLFGKMQLVYGDDYINFKYGEAGNLLYYAYSTLLTSFCKSLLVFLFQKPITILQDSTADSFSYHKTQGCMLAYPIYLTKSHVFHFSTFVPIYHRISHPCPKSKGPAQEYYERVRFGPKTET
jgi:hypothetical protein